MDESSLPTAIADRRFRYFHENQKGSADAIDVHHIIVKRSKIKKSILILFALLLSSSSICFLCLQGKLFPALWSLVLVAFIFKLFLQKLVEKVGELVGDFFMLGNILKPVLNECVTPVTCYWSLALIIRGEEELVLVFKELRPPIKMLVPIWKALNAAIDVED